LIAFGCILMATFAGAQSPATPTMPNDPRALMQLAAMENGISSSDGPPWHMVATFKLFDEQGNVKDQGEFEEYWKDPKVFVQRFASMGYSRVYYGTSNGGLITNSQPLPSPLMAHIYSFAYPVPTASQIAGFDLKVETRNIDDTESVCISMKSKTSVLGSQTQTREPVDVTYCFDTATNTLQSTVYSLLNTEIIRSHPKHFRGRSVSGDLEVKHEGKVAFTAHLETVELLAAIDDSVFDPSPDATLMPVELGMPNLTSENGKVRVPPFMGSTLVFKRVGVDYPLIAKLRNEQGVVELQITIDKNGHVKEIHAISGPNIFMEASLKAVRQWVFKPALLHHVPVEVETTVTIHFQNVNKP